MITLYSKFKIIKNPPVKHSIYIQRRGFELPYSYLISRDFNFAIFAVVKKSRN
jgi:hypothetical protein